MVPGILLLVILLGAAPRPGVPADTAGDGARRYVREAILAVERDSAPSLVARWSARLGADSADRAPLLGLATAARLTNDDSTALRLYLRLIRSSARGGDAYATYARLGLARLYTDRADLPAADSAARAALAEARRRHDHAAEGEALLALANARMDQDARAGRAYLDSALRTLPPAETELAAEVRCRRARLGFRSGDPGFPRDLSAGLDYARRVGAHRAEAQCLRTAAVDRFTRGLTDSAIVLLRRSAELQRAARERRALAFTLTTLAEVFRDRGAYGDARAATLEALDQARASRDVQGEALATNMVGTLAYSLRDLASARRALDRADSLYGTLRDSADQMNVRSWQANIARDQGDLGRARQLTHEVIAAARREQAVPWTIELFIALADVEILGGDYPAAAAALDTAGGLLRAHRIESWAPKLAFQRARLALRRGDLASAERIFRDYRRTLGDADGLRRHEVESYLAEIRARRGDLAGAERDLAAAGDALETWRAGLGDEALRLFAFQASATDESDGNATVARVIAALAAGGRIEAALGLAERRRARELGDRLVAAAALEGSAPAPTRASVVATSRIAYDELARLLPDSTAVLEYVTGPFGAPTTAFVVLRGASPAARILARADSLAGPIGRFLALVAARADMNADAAALGRALLDPVLPLLGPGVTRLVIVPDGPLHRVPWDLLRLEDGRHVVERFAVGIAPSAGALALLRRHPLPAQAAGAVRVLAIGDPAFGRLAPADTELFAAAGGLPRLPGSGEEARLVARYAPAAELRLGDRASAAYLRQAPLDSFRVIHLATHALVDDRALGRTALALAPGDSGSGLVTPNELARLRLRADLVVLSACRTAGGMAVDGEGLQGLTAPLLEAGARSVVATSWRVGDRSTLRLVDGLYAGLAKGRPVIEALREAKLGAMRSGAPPAAWAAFVLVGDPATMVPLTPPRTRPAWWVGAGCVILLAAATTLWRRRSRPPAPHLRAQGRAHGR
jgi:CHAT domain-containing protein/tetratricopeptide (TPR) repeat protein